MANYSIKDLERLSGIKAHTIRIWEQRYQLLNPIRSETNIRSYDDQQLKHLLNVSLLVENGLKISKISRFSREEFNEEIVNLFQRTNDQLVDHAIELKINGLIVAMIDLDEEKFNKIFSTSILQNGFETTILSLIYPFLEKVGIMWSIGDINPAQEHFISNLIRQKIIVAIDGLPAPDPNAEKFILFLREKELHEIGLLLASYLLKTKSKIVYYLGQNLPFDDLREAKKVCNPQYLMTFLITPAPEKEVQEYLDKLSLAFSEQTLLISGNSKVLSNLQLPDNLKWLKSIHELLDAVDSK